MCPGEKKKTWIAGNIKGFFFKPVELDIHTYKVYSSNTAFVKALAFFKLIMYTFTRGNNVERH